ncbi:MAG: AsmA family protein [Rhodomicrobium sp.]
MGRILATFATLLILVLAAALVLPAFVDWKAYRPDIERAASAVLGRNVQINGDIEIELLPEPHLRASKVAAENGIDDDTLLTADAVDLTLSLQALFAGQVEASKLRLVRPSLTVDFSKPYKAAKSGKPAGAGSSSPVAAGVSGIEIENGRFSVISLSGAKHQSLVLTKINGTVLSIPNNHSYRFNGQFVHNGGQYDAKFLAAAGADKTVKISGTALDLASKAAYQADGLLSAAPTPAFEGSLAINMPQSGAAFDEFPLEAQLKSTAKIGLSDAALGDITLTIDPQNRPQVLAGTARIGFSEKAADIALQASSLDADALLSNPGSGFQPAAPNGQDWSSLKAAAGRFLWLYPDFNLRFALDAGLVQLKGEPLEKVTIHGSRSGERWTFEQAEGALPGDSFIKLAGTLRRADRVDRLSATASIEGKNLGRLSRWIAPAATPAKTAAGQSFALRGALTLSPEVTAFEGVTGSLDGTAFTGSLHLDRGPSRRLQLSLSGNNFDFSSLTGEGEPAGLSPESVKAAWQAASSGIAEIVSGSGRDIDIADVDISAASVKLAGTEAKNVAIKVKADGNRLTIARLGVEMPGGLTVQGAGEFPLSGAGPGSFDGKIEAKSPQAIAQLVALAGLDANSGGRHPEDFAPGLLSLSYAAETGTGRSSAQITGNLGLMRVDGRVQLGGILTDWAKDPLSGQLRVSAPNGNKLVTLIFPSAILPPEASASSGEIAIRINGTSAKLETSASLNSGALQAQFDGTGAFPARSPTLIGRFSASSQSPEQFLPAPVLALLGGEPKANLHVDAGVTLAPGRFDAQGLKAESPKNAVTGHLAVNTAGGVTRANADLKADSASLPNLLSYFQTPAEAPALTVPTALTSEQTAPAPEIWSSRPFSIAAFQDTVANISLGVKELSLGDSLVLSDARMEARLGKQRLEIGTIEGKAFGGDVDASMNLAVKGSAAMEGTANIALNGVNLSLVPNAGTVPMATGKASLSLSVSGQGLSPRGIISVLQGRGVISISDGQLTRLSPGAVQKSADELLANPLPLTEEAISKKVLEAAQTSDLGFRRLKIPLTIHDGLLEIRRASFRGRDATVRMEGYLDLSKMAVDSTWQLGVRSDRRVKWPPVKILVSGPLRELGSRPRTLSADDFSRAILVHKMEGDIARLEGLNKPQPAAQPWTTTQEETQKHDRGRKRNRKKPEEGSPQPAAGAAGQRQTPAQAATSDFEARIRDALKNQAKSAGQ